MPKEEIIKAFILLAEERLRTARRDLQANAFRDAAARSYYAMFHATSALLNAMDLQFKSHKGTVGLFGEHVVKAGLVEEEYGRMLNKTLDLRETADYKVTKEVTVKEAREAVASAEKFVLRIKEILESKYGIVGE